MASSFFIFLPSISLSTAILKSNNCSVTIAFKTVISFEQLDFEPTVLNSNLFPVKAIGAVRFRSVLSRSISGIFPITFSLRSVFSSGDSLPFETCSRSSITLKRYFPMNTERLEDGASLTPILRSLLAETVAAFIRFLCFKTAVIVLIKKDKNCRLLIGVLPGLRRLMPVFVLRDQLVCLPEPLILSNGFS